MTSQFIPKMSYSSACLMRKCERKYWLSKVAQAPVDSDASIDTEAFLYGKVYHEILEVTRHKRPGDLKAVTLQVGKKHGMVRDQIFRVYAMADKYYSCREQTGLVEVASEIRFQDEDFIGFIDSLIEDPVSGLWWILDLKTSTRIGAMLAARVHKDYQLNFYASFLDDIVKALKLQKAKFAGVRYSICTRPQAKPKRTETLKEYARRATVQYEEYVVDASALDPQMARAFVQEARDRQNILFKIKNIEETKPNFLSCEDYFKACEYWSHCYGHNVTSTNKIPKTTFSKPSPESIVTEDELDF